MRAIFELEPVDKESASRLRSFIDTLGGHMKSLKAIGYDPEAWGPMLVHIICTKLDGKTLR